MIEPTTDPADFEDFWTAPHATEAPFLEAPHSHGCPLTTRGGTCTCSPVCTCAWPGSRCEYPHAAQDGAGAPISPQSGTRGGSGVSQGLTEALSVDSIAGLYADQAGIAHQSREFKVAFVRAFHRAMERGFDLDLICGTTAHSIQPMPDPYNRGSTLCHCGRPQISEETEQNRGMCYWCDSVRCDAYPGACEPSRPIDYSALNDAVWVGEDE